LAKNRYRDTVSDASNEDSLEVNAGETKHTDMFMSCHLAAGQNHSKNVDFKYFKMW